MNEKNQSGDIVELNLPDYTEERNAVPDVETESSFAENREEIFLRNRELAAGTFREEFPENPDAEEIYPQVRVVSEDNRPAPLNASAKGVKAAGTGSRRKNKKLGRLERICCTAVIAVAAIAAIAVISNGAATVSRGISVNAAAVEKADEKAKQMHTASAAGLAQLIVEGAEVNGSTFENSGTVFIFGDAEVNTADFLGNSFSGYVYGEFDSETYSSLYALWSAEPIPDEYKRVLTDSEQEALAGEGIIIGCYPAVD